MDCYHTISNTVPPLSILLFMDFIFPPPPIQLLTSPPYLFHSPKEKNVHFVGNSPGVKTHLLMHIGKVIKIVRETQEITMWRYITIVPPFLLYTLFLFLIPEFNSSTANFLFRCSVWHTGGLAYALLPNVGGMMPSSKQELYNSRQLSILTFCRVRL